MSLDRSFGIKAGVFGLLVVLAIWFGLFLLRPTATVATAQRGRAINAVPGSVTVLAERTIEVRSDVAGRILRSYAELSKKFDAGGVLAEIDPTDVNLEIEQIRNDLDAMRRRIEIGSATTFELINAREALENAERLHRQGNVSLSDLERQRRAVKLIEQKLELENVADRQALSRLENALRVRQRQLERMTIRTPAEGVVTAIHAAEGDLIAAGAPIATLIADARIVEARISEENFAGLRLGQAATVRFLGYGATQYRAEVERILPAAEAATQRYIVHLKVDIDPALLVPGITGEVNIVVDARDDAVIIPRRAVFGRNVFVVENGRVRLRTVELGFTSLNEVEILRGIEPGERVVVEDLDRMRDGDRVSVVEARS